MTKKFGEIVDIDRAVMDTCHVTAFISNTNIDYTDMEGWEQTGITVGRKYLLDRSLTELATLLKIKHGYTIDVDITLERLWNLSKADMFGIDKIDIYYRPDKMTPVLFRGGTNTIAIAPREIDHELEEEEQTDMEE